jgi:hypothetical protein
MSLRERWAKNRARQKAEEEYAPQEIKRALNMAYIGVIVSFTGIPVMMAFPFLEPYLYALLGWCFGACIAFEYVYLLKVEEGKKAGVIA